MRILSPSFFTAIALSAVTAIPLQAEVLNPYLRTAIRTLHSNATKTVAARSSSSNEPETNYIPVIIKLDDAGTELPPFVTELHRREELVLATVEEQRIEELASYNMIARIEARTASAPQMSEALKFCNLPQIRHSDSDRIPLTGEGVVVGFCDTGFWPGHINFSNGEGTSRVRKIVNYTLGNPLPYVTENPVEIMAYTTDNTDETHATHVAGILTGGYDTQGYAGVAPNADIVATTSPLYDAYILDGCEQIIDYAENAGKPAVINISVSSSTGAHDGTSLFNQYMEKLSDDAVVCISASNDGYRPCYIEQTFSSGKNTVRTYPRQWPSRSPLEVRGIIDVWSSDERPLKLNVVGWNIPDSEITFRWESESVLADGEELIICSPDLADKFPGHAEELLPDRYSGYICVTAEINPENGRYNVMYYCDVTDLTTTDHYAAETIFGPEITGDDGQKIEIYASSQILLTTSSDPMALSGSTDRSVNDMCTGYGPICVGAFNSRTLIPNLDGEEWEPVKNTITGEVSYFSGYATLNNGNRLPHLCAPGAQVVSSISSEYVREHPEAFTYLCFKISHNGEDYYWGSDQGTSMSSPYAAGVMALWLQANPDLSPREIRNIAFSTTSVPTSDPDNPQWGGGIIDAKAGLERVLETGSTISVNPDLTTTDTGLTVKALGNRRYALAHGNSILIAATITDVSGRQVATADVTGFPAIVDCSNLADAVYLIHAIDASGHSHSCKLSVR